MLKHVRSVGAALILLCAGSAVQAEPTAQQLMERNFYISKISMLKSQTTMSLIAADGQKRERKMETLSKLQKNGIDSNLIVRFQYPADIKGTGFLEMERADADDDLWIYLPALQKVRRLISNNKKDSFMGSDFSYGEMLPPRVELYQHTLLRSETVENQDCYVIQSIPVSDKVRNDSGYSKKISWLRKDSALEAKVEYYDLEGQLLKVQWLRQPKLVEADKGRWLAQSREMTNVQTGHKTLFSLDVIDTKVSIADNVFSTRTLESR
ncbi:outer membrane lipoprotein-sorting protein [Paraherbaspirillum soli]|uniref:Outer membrane lipoprotein-sorting protein n=1 Tax=Paraherbaspirillum soli TaxID=631222 RepID=A0ABW0MFY0_9BURK